MKKHESLARENHVNNANGACYFDEKYVLLLLVNLSKIATFEE